MNAYPEKQHYTADDLAAIIAILRDPDNGCPWDKVQTHRSIRMNFLEEAYEAVDAIDLDDPELLCEELGDVLMQVVFHAQIEREAGHFTFAEVCDGVCRKLLDRHPHIFRGDESIKDWDSLKNKEKGRLTLTDELESVPKALPALMRAQKIQKKAKSIGFDWQAPEPAAGKVKEELAELLEALQEGPVRTEEEAGDLLFAAVNVVRLCGVHAETALMGACEKFIRRFRAMEQAAVRSGITLSSQTLETLDGLWEETKRLEKQEKA